MHERAGRENGTAMKHEVGNGDVNHFFPPAGALHLVEFVDGSDWPGCC